VSWGIGLSEENLVLLLEEYERMQQICNPIIEFYKAENCSLALLDILQALCPANNFINYKISDDIENLYSAIRYRDKFRKAN
jgi:hypothetical protein